MPIVYLITHIDSGRGYVGQYINDCVERRWKRHQREARNGSHLPFHRAIAKYGSDAFKVEVLYQYESHYVINILEELCAGELETYIWDSPGGFNACWAGVKPRMLGLKHTAEAKAKISEANRRRWKKWRETPAGPPADPAPPPPA